MPDIPNTRIPLVSSDDLPTTRPREVLDVLAEAGDALAQILNAHRCDTTQDWLRRSVAEIDGHAPDRGLTQAG